MPSPQAHRVRVRTTNGLERFNQELKRRTRVVRIFPNRAALAMEQSEEWVSGRRYLTLEPLEEAPSRPARSVAEAA
jgi:transposase-like protein